MSGDLENVWDQREVRDPTTHHLLSYAGLECRVLGTFYGSDLRGGTGVGHVLTFGSDLSNYYHTHGLKVFTPRCDALERIVNYRDPRTHADAATAMVSVGAVRYTSSHRAFQQVDGLAVSMTPTDLLGQKTALFGMTRTGKSNTTKIVLKTIFELRWQPAALRIGQVIYDPNGEYATENAQHA